jgi:hypothetical protein
LGFVAGDGQSRPDRLVIGSLTLGNAPDTPTMRTLDLNKDGLPIGLQTKEYTLPNATSVFDPGLVSLTVGPKGIYYRTRDAALGYRLWDATDALSAEGKMAVGSVQAVSSELVGGRLLVALDHAFNETHDKDANGNPLMGIDGFFLQSIPLSADGRPIQVIPSEARGAHHNNALDGRAGLSGSRPDLQPVLGSQARPRIPWFAGGRSNTLERQRDGVVPTWYAVLEIGF